MKKCLPLLLTLLILLIGADKAPCRSANETGFLSEGERANLFLEIYTKAQINLRKSKLRELKKRHKWDRRIWSAIERLDVVIGMTKQQAVLSWGEPNYQTNTEDKKGKKEFWFYDLGNNLTFSNGKISHIQRTDPTPEPVAPVMIGHVLRNDTPIYKSAFTKKVLVFVPAGTYLALTAASDYRYVVYLRDGRSGWVPKSRVEILYEDE